MDETKKTYYSISEVCSRTELEPHVLRYWESEFPQLRPKKNRAGNRAYREKDIETIRYIKKLLYEEQYTIPGAKKKLAGNKVMETHHHAQTNLFAPVRNGAKEEAIKGLREVLSILQS
ncbi:MAG: MerR family transcriptional regulator [Chitinivibrionales bacterium]|nr:MerR family transcriptional regulator [Chitinivibrionales bacterium]